MKSLILLCLFFAAAKDAKAQYSDCYDFPPKLVIAYDWWINQTPMTIPEKNSRCASKDGERAGRRELTPPAHRRVFIIILIPQ